jgi:hypothetical protein
VPSRFIANTQLAAKTVVCAREAGGRSAFGEWLDKDRLFSFHSQNITRKDTQGGYAPSLANGEV